jgi:hypothetical protein
LLTTKGGNIQFIAVGDDESLPMDEDPRKDEQLRLPQRMW